MIPAKAKVLAIVTMVVSLVYFGLFTEAAIWLKGVTAGAVFILSKPARLPQ